jgi:hypothetical protein
MTQKAALSLDGLEQIYDALAQAIDHAGEEKSELLLVKLALLSAQALGDHDRFLRLVQQASDDLGPD